MCGIVGLFLKEKELYPELGKLLTQMLLTMSDRGPDSSGIAVYSDSNTSEFGNKLTVMSANPDTEFPLLKLELDKKLNRKIALQQKHNHGVLHLSQEELQFVPAYIKSILPDIRAMSKGKRIEIYKEVGKPSKVTEQFGVSAMGGSHGIGHTRMATESKVTTFGAHPFSTGSDQCLVHNGSLSNHNLLRRKLSREGIEVETDNDSEVAAAYLTWQMAKGLSLEQSLQKGLTELDGFYTFLVGTKNGFGVLRDPIACKPAVMAETQEYVAFGSEYRAFAKLPEIQSARVWEPEPATVYFWEL